MYSSRRISLAALRLALEPRAKRRIFLFHQTGDLPKSELFDVIIEEQQLFMIVQRRKRRIDRGQRRRTISVARYLVDHLVLAARRRRRKAGVRHALTYVLGHLIQRNFVMTGSMQIDKRVPDHGP